MLEGNGSQCKKKTVLIAAIGFSLLFLVGIVYMLVGAALPMLALRYGRPVGTVVLMSSAFASGRFATAFVSGKIVEMAGAKKVVAAGIVLMASYLFVAAASKNFAFALAAAFFGGIGMGIQDASSPILFAHSFSKRNYAFAISLSEAAYGIGNFFTPFFTGLFLAAGIDFQFAFFSLLVVPAAMLVLLHFSDFGEIGKCRFSSAERSAVEPLFVRNLTFAGVACAIFGFAYCVAVQAIQLFTVSFAASKGFSVAQSEFFLTAFNVGNVAGCLIFAPILRKVGVSAIAFANSFFAALVFAATIFLKGAAAHFSALFFGGLLLGPLYGVFVVLATRLGWRRVSVAASLVAMAGGLSDIVAPAAAGFFADRFGIFAAFGFAVAVLTASAASAAVMSFFFRTARR